MTTRSPIALIRTLASTLTSMANSISSLNTALANKLDNTFAVFLAGNEPATPSAGTVIDYAVLSAGRILRKYKGPSGLDNVYQNGLAGKTYLLCTPQATTNASAIGWPVVGYGTTSNPALTTTQVPRTSTNRFTCTTAATASAVAGIRSSVAKLWRYSGFDFTERFSIGATTGNYSFFAGLSPAVVQLTNTTVVTTLANTIGVGADSTDTNIQIFTRDASTTNKVDTGFPKSDTASVYALRLFCHQNDLTKVGYELLNMRTGVIFSGSFNANLPVSTTLLAWHTHVCNGGTAVAVSIEMVNNYVEVDL